MQRAWVPWREPGLVYDGSPLPVGVRSTRSGNIAPIESITARAAEECPKLRPELIGRGSDAADQGRELGNWAGIEDGPGGNLGALGNEEPVPTVALIVDPRERRRISLLSGRISALKSYGVFM
jgi:hypothetical protein